MRELRCHLHCAKQRGGHQQSIEQPAGSDRGAQGMVRKQDAQRRKGKERIQQVAWREIRNHAGGEQIADEPKSKNYSQRLVAPMTQAIAKKEESDEESGA